MTDIIPFVPSMTESNAPAGVSTLLTELWREADSTSRRLRAASIRLGRLEEDFNIRVRDLDSLSGTAAERAQRRSVLTRERDGAEEALGLESLIDDHSRALLRFNRVALVYRVAHTYSLDSVISVNVRRALLGTMGPLGTSPQIQAAFRELARAVREYCHDTRQLGNDGRVRQAWEDVEVLLEANG